MYPGRGKARQEDPMRLNRSYSAWLQRYRKHALVLCGGVILALVAFHIAGNHLHQRSRHADPEQPWDAVYLVCGAKAQSYRINALTQWLKKTPTPPALILIGHDNQNSLWSREHQRNLTRAEWAHVTLTQWVSENIPHTDLDIVILEESSFSNTDGEMQVLGQTLASRSDLQRLAIVTCRFHTKRALNRLENYAPTEITLSAIPGAKRLFDRWPWVVTLEYVKLLRDALGHSQSRFVSRPLGEPIDHDISY